jgi:hypothetical protein
VKKVQADCINAILIHTQSQSTWQARQLHRKIVIVSRSNTHSTAPYKSPFPAT